MLFHLDCFKTMQPWYRTIVVCFTLLTLFQSEKISAQYCKGWEIDLSHQDMANPPRTVSVNTRDKRIFCSLEAEQRGECEIAPEGIFHVLSLVRCPPQGDARKFDEAAANPNQSYDLALLSLCTAVRIGKSWALTAAHCLANKDNRIMLPDELALALDFKHQRVRRLAVLPILKIEQSGDDLALLKIDPSSAPSLNIIPTNKMGITEIYSPDRLTEMRQNLIDMGINNEETDWPPKSKIWGYGQTNANIQEGGGLLGRLVEATVKLDNSSLTHSEKSRLLRANSSDANAPKLCSGDSGGPWFIQNTGLIGLSIKSAATCDASSSNIADAIRVAPFCSWIETTSCSAGEAICCMRAGTERPEDRSTPNGCNCANQ